MTPSLLKLLASLFLWLARICLRPAPPPPRPFGWSSRKVVRMSMPTVEFDVSINPPPLPLLPAGEAPIATLELTLQVNGTAQPAVDIPLTATAFDLGTYPSGTTLTASLVYIDASGVRSAPLVESYSVIAPPAPGAFTFTSVEVTGPTPSSVKKS